MENQVRYFATFDADGWPTGLFPSDIWPEPPDAAVEITEEQWQQLLTGNYLFVDGDLVDRPPPEPLPPPVPQTLSRRQFFQQAAINDYITEDEALAAVTVGAIPQAMNDYIATLPSGDQFNARMLFSGAQAFERGTDKTADFSHWLGMDDPQIDQFFIDGAALTA